MKMLFGRRVGDEVKEGGGAAAGRRGMMTTRMMLRMLTGIFFLQALMPAVNGSGMGVAAGPVNPPDPVPIEPEQPTFMTVGKTYQIPLEDTVVLPCDVAKLGNYVLVWKRGIAVLTAGPTKVTPDDRFRLVDGYNLEIRSVAPTDGGDYVCQIGTLEPKEIMHTLEILVPPRIQKVTSNGEMEVRKGTSVTLECRATGNPVPIITWTRKNNLLPSGEKSVQGYSITIEKVTRHHAGVYECTASNNVGDPVTQRINLNVHYSPEIEVEKTWVHSGEGYEAQLVCLVHSEPPGEVVWFRDTLRLETSERHIMEVRGSRHTLILPKVQGSDFGNYTCVATNSLGRASRYLQLSGIPNPPEYISSIMGRYTERYNLTWTVVSLSPIEEFKLSFRKLQQQQTAHGEKLQSPQGNPKRTGRRDNETFVMAQRLGEWNEVVLSTPPVEQTSHTMSYMIHGLEAGAQYEAMVQAKNRFGWSEVSRHFIFNTRSSEPEVRDMEVIHAGKVNANAAASAMPRAPPATLLLALAVVSAMATVVSAAAAAMLLPASNSAAVVGYGRSAGRCLFDAANRRAAALLGSR